MNPSMIPAALLAVVGCVAAVTVQHYQDLQHHEVAQQKKPHIPILKQDYQLSKEGYQFSYETGNGIHFQESGHIKNLGDKKHETLVQQGSVTYHDEHGHPITLTYIADENGFQPQGAHLPTPPPIPHAIQKSLQLQSINAHQEQEQEQVLQQNIGEEAEPQYGHYYE